MAASACAFIQYGIALIVVAVATAASVSDDSSCHSSGGHLPKNAFTTKQLPVDKNLMPVLSNGHVGVQVLSDSVYMNGLYSGAHGLSHRARIPNYANIIIENATVVGGDEDERVPGALKPVSHLNTENYYTFNIETGIYRSTYIHHDHRNNIHFRVVHSTFVHRYFMRTIINRLTIERLNNTIVAGEQHQRNGTKNVRYSRLAERMDNKGNITIYLRQVAGAATDDILFNRTATRHHSNIDIVNGSYNRTSTSTTAITSMCGRTAIIEDIDYQTRTESTVCVLWTHVADRITLAANTNYAAATFVMAVDDRFDGAIQEIRDVLNLSYERVEKLHVKKWSDLWANFRIDVAGNRDLSNAIWTSLYAITSALPPLSSSSFTDNTKSNRTRLFYGLSPTGLGRGGGKNLGDYEGHSMWDTEIWMHPVVLAIQPEWSTLLLRYRHAKQLAAGNLARTTGHRGLRFPWESAYTGADVTQPCCPSIAARQLHVTADIGRAVRHHFAATHDLEWAARDGWKLAHGIADYWQSRAQLNTSIGLYELCDIMGPDEDHDNVSNNAYTNVAAGMALYFADFLECILEGEPKKNKYANVAKHLKLSYDNHMDYHPQYDGYKMHTTIKQADAVLLGYPLQYNMKRSTRANDLRIYESVTRTDGPAMTWAMHTIGHLELDRMNEAGRLFVASYRDYIHGPFRVWREVAGRIDNGATNFITGAGGFLQSVIFGYGGIRLYDDRLEIRNARLPPNCTDFVISGFHYLGSRLEIFVNKNSDAVLKVKESGRERLTLTYHNATTVHELCARCTYNITNATVSIQSVDNRLVFGNCELPHDIIGIPISNQ